MTNMNLSTSENRNISQESISTKNGLIFISMSLVLVVALYGGLIGWKKVLDNKIVVATKTYNTNYAELMSGMNIEVTDLQNRIFLSKKLIKQNNPMRDVLENIEKNIVSGVYLTAYDSNRDAHTLKLMGFANSFNDLSRQILSLKSSEIFSSVNVDNSKVSEDGKISFSINLEFK